MGVPGSLCRQQGRLSQSLDSAFLEHLVPGTAFRGKTEGSKTDTALTELTSNGKTKQISIHLCVLHLRHGVDWETCPRLGVKLSRSSQMHKAPPTPPRMFQNLPWGCLPGIPSPVGSPRAKLWRVYPVQSEGRKKTGHGWGPNWVAS